MFHPSLLKEASPSCRVGGAGRGHSAVSFKLRAQNRVRIGVYTHTPPTPTVLPVLRTVTGMAGKEQVLQHRCNPPALGRTPQHARGRRLHFPIAPGPPCSPRGRNRSPTALTPACGGEQPSRPSGYEISPNTGVLVEAGRQNKGRCVGGNGPFGPGIHAAARQASEATIF